MSEFYARELLLCGEKTSLVMVNNFTRYSKETLSSLCTNT